MVSVNLFQINLYLKVLTCCKCKISLVPLFAAGCLAIPSPRLGCMEMYPVG
jgi:hypothetical protein